MRPQSASVRSIDDGGSSTDCGTQRTGGIPAGARIHSVQLVLPELYQISLADVPIERTTTLPRAPT